MTNTRIILKPHKDEPLRRFHPWVFSGAVQKIEGKPQDGDIVDIYSSANQWLACGHYHQGSILVRVISFEQTPINEDFWYQRLSQAYQLRQTLNLVENRQTDAYRLIHGEGDNCSGLIIDIYGDTAVLQAHSIGMHLAKTQLVSALQRLYGTKLRAIYDKSRSTLPEKYAQNVTDGYLWGDTSTDTRQVFENQHEFAINWVTGQKTGFFLDQRDNRALLGRYATGKTVLNAFCYSGGFSIYALASGATMVHSVDASAKAIELVEQNVSLNGFGADRHQSYTEDVLKFLKNSTAEYDVIVLDPPAYAKTIEKRHQAVQGYKRLNIEGLQKIKSGGILFTFSCSQVVDRALFYNTILSAAIEAKRNVRVLHHLSQPADHPVSIFHSESSYLKGLVLYVE